MARSSEASRCPLARACHPHERPLQRHGHTVSTETAPSDAIRGSLTTISEGANAGAQTSASLARLKFGGSGLGPKQEASDGRTFSRERTWADMKLSDGAGGTFGAGELGEELS